MSSLLRVVVVLPGADRADDAGGLESALRRAGAAARLAALPIHAAHPLEVEALTGLGRGETGIFDDWRAEAYRPAPTHDAGPRPDSLIEAARQAGIPVVEGVAGLGEEPRTAIVRVVDDGTLEGAAGRAGGGGTVVWLQPSTTVRVHHVINPQAVLASTGLLELDGAGRPDWSRSLAYHVGQGQVWVNLRGREPHGIVRPGEEHDEVRRALRSVLSERLVDPASSEPVARVFLKEDLYAGSRLWAAPDLVLCPEADYAFSTAAVAGDMEETAVRREEALAWRPGCWGVTGWGARGDWEAAPVDILSLAPTVSEILGVPLPGRAQGRVLREHFTEAFWASRPAAPRPHGPTLSPDEERLVSRRLGELGYLE